MNHPESLPPIMVIEDDLEIREALVEILSSEGYPILAASNGREALEVLRRESVLPRAIILDLMMPIMDGWLFRNHQLQDSNLARIPVIVITANGNAGAKAKAMNAAFGVCKPIDIPLLLGSLRDAVQMY